MTERLRIGVFVPGLHGGVDEATHHLFGAGTTGSCDTRIYETKGRNAKVAPLVFARILLVVAWDRLRGRLDGAHVNMSFRGSTVRKVIVGLLLIVLRVPFVLQIHSGGYGDFWARLGSTPRSIIRFVVRRAERVLVLGEPFRTLAVDSLGVEPDRVMIVPNGVPVAASAGGTPDREPHVLYLGRLHANKGTYELIEALAKLADHGWTATLAGNDEVDETRAAVEASGLGERITVLDWIDRQAALDLLARSDVFVLASREEAMSMSLLEAMGHGLACIATPVGAQVDFLVDEGNALLINPGAVDELIEALSRLLSDPGLRSELGAEAYRTASTRFERSVVRETLERIYVSDFS